MQFSIYYFHIILLCPQNRSRVRGTLIPTNATDYRSFLTSVIPSIVIILYHVCPTHEIPLETGCQIPKRVRQYTHGGSSSILYRWVTADVKVTMLHLKKKSNLVCPSSTRIHTPHPLYSIPCYLSVLVSLILNFLHIRYLVQQCRFRFFSTKWL